MDFTIIVAKDRKEIESVHKTMLEAFKEYNAYDTPSSAMNESALSIEEAVQKGTEQAILCFSEGTPLGSARFIIEQDSLYFKRLSVVPEARGKGVAKALIQWMEKYVKEKGLVKIYCRVRKDTPQNIEFYQHSDFYISKEETIINKDGNVVNIIQMEKIVKVLA